MALVHLNRVKFATATTGTGTLTAGAAAGVAFMLPAAAGGVDGDLVDYLIEEGNDFEIGRGTLANSATELARTTVFISKISGTVGTTKMSLNGNALVRFIAAGDDMLAKFNNLSDLSAKYTAYDNLSLKGADIASAATLNLEAATGNVVDVTGTTTVTAITLSEGHRRLIRTTGAFLLTHGANLVLPGAANITTAAGDFYEFVGYASSVVRLARYQRAAGRPLTTGVTDTVAVGFSVAPNSLGTMSSFTINPALGNYQYGTNNGAFTLTAPTSDCAIDLLVTNGASAGTITFSGFTVASSNIGDPLTTTNGHRFLVMIRRINSISTYAIKALQ